MKVVWTREAEKTFNNVINYLLEKWTIKEAVSFVDIVDDTIEQIVIHPEMFKTSNYDIKSQEAFITKHTTMFYRILDNVIEIEYFWGNFQNPKKIKDILKT